MHKMKNVMKQCGRVLLLATLLLTTQTGIADITATQTAIVDALEAQRAKLAETKDLVDQVRAEGKRRADEIQPIIVKLQNAIGESRGPAASTGLYKYAHENGVYNKANAAYNTSLASPEVTGANNTQVILDALKVILDDLKRADKFGQAGGIAAKDLASVKFREVVKLVKAYKSAEKVRLDNLVADVRQIRINMIPDGGYESIQQMFGEHGGGDQAQRGIIAAVEQLYQQIRIIQEKFNPGKEYAEVYERSADGDGLKQAFADYQAQVPVNYDVRVSRFTTFLDQVKGANALADLSEDVNSKDKAQVIINEIKDFKDEMDDAYSDYAELEQLAQELDKAYKALETLRGHKLATYDKGAADGKGAEVVMWDGDHTGNIKADFLKVHAPAVIDGDIAGVAGDYKGVPVVAAAVRAYNTDSMALQIKIADVEGQIKRWYTELQKVRYSNLLFGKPDELSAYFTTGAGKGAVDALYAAYQKRQEVELLAESAKEAFEAIVAVTRKAGGAVAVLADLNVQGNFAQLPVASADLPAGVVKLEAGKSYVYGSGDTLAIRAEHLGDGDDPVQKLTKEINRYYEEAVNAAAAVANAIANQVAEFKKPDATPTKFNDVKAAVEALNQGSGHVATMRTAIENYRRAYAMLKPTMDGAVDLAQAERLIQETGVILAAKNVEQNARATDLGAIDLVEATDGISDQALTDHDVATLTSTAGAERVAAQAAVQAYAQRLQVVENLLDEARSEADAAQKKAKAQAAKAAAELGAGPDSFATLNGQVEAAILRAQNAVAVANKAVADARAASRAAAADAQEIAQIQTRVRGLSRVNRNPGGGAVAVPPAPNPLRALAQDLNEALRNFNQGVDDLGARVREVAAATDKATAQAAEAQVNALHPRLTAGGDLLKEVEVARRAYLAKEQDIARATALKSQAQAEADQRAAQEVLRDADGAFTQQKVDFMNIGTIDNHKDLAALPAQVTKAYLAIEKAKNAVAKFEQKVQGVQDLIDAINFSSPDHGKEAAKTAKDAAQSVAVGTDLFKTLNEAAETNIAFASDAIAAANRAIADARAASVAAAADAAELAQIQARVRALPRVNRNPGGGAVAVPHAPNPLRALAEDLNEALRIFNEGVDKLATKAGEVAAATDKATAQAAEAQVNALHTRLTAGGNLLTAVELARQAYDEASAKIQRVTALKRQVQVLQDAARDKNTEFYDTIPDKVAIADRPDDDGDEQRAYDEAFGDDGNGGKRALAVAAVADLDTAINAIKPADVAPGNVVAAQALLAAAQNLSGAAGRPVERAQAAVQTARDTAATYATAKSAAEAPPLVIAVEDAGSLGDAATGGDAPSTDWDALIASVRALEADDDADTISDGLIGLKEDVEDACKAAITGNNLDKAGITVLQGLVNALSDKLDDFDHMDALEVKDAVDAAVVEKFTEGM